MTTAAAPLALEAAVDDGPDVYHFRTADGVASPESFRTTELLLLRALHGENPGDHLTVEANYGVVGVCLAPSADSVRLAESSARRATLCRVNARENDVDARAAVVADLRRLPGRYDTAAYAPESHTPLSVGKQRIADALTRLRPGGRLFLAARKHAGLNRYVDCLGELTEDPETVLSADDVSVLVAERPPSFEAPQYVTPTAFEARIGEYTVPLTTVPGLFAAGRVDDGTRLLAETATVRDGERVLDLCCGAGPLGCYAGLDADCSVTLSDDDRVAARAAACSLQRAGVDGRVLTADGTAGVAGERFDLVLCNPPTHAGRGVLSELFAGAARVLAPGGRCLLVHHRSLNLRGQLRGFDAVSRIATGEEHVVLRARTRR